MPAGYLDNTRTLFTYYKLLAEKAMEQVPDEKLFWQYNEESNSIAIIVKHLWGNMLSRWTDFLTSDGEKEWRDREAEFDNDLQNRDNVLQRWQEGWTCLFAALDELKEEDLSKTIYIRNMGQSVLDAVNRQLAHYSSHVGQLIFLAKMITGPAWKSLSIPRGASQHYNSNKFSQPKRDEDFTDELLQGR